jgi:hypothetical protein
MKATENQIGGGQNDQGNTPADIPPHTSLSHSRGVGEPLCQGQCCENCDSGNTEKNDTAA